MKATIAKLCHHTVIMAWVFTLLMAASLASEEDNYLDYKDPATGMAFNQIIYNECLADPGQMEAWLELPPALAIPRLEYFMMHGAAFPEHSRKARELMKKVPGWMEYYQWILADTYKDANPPPGVKGVLLDTDESLTWFGKVVAARVKMGKIFRHLTYTYFSDPGTVSLIAPYLDDQGPQMGGSDYGYENVEGYSRDAISNYFKRQTGKWPGMLPEQWRAWWKANKANYPALPEQPKKPWFPPPATQEPASPRPDAEAETKTTNAEFRKTILRYKALRNEMEKRRILPPASPVTPAPQEQR